MEKELPDYILSIITNRKDKDYMTKSLSVFMGSKANAFTEWYEFYFERQILKTNLSDALI